MNPFNLNMSSKSRSNNVKTFSSLRTDDIQYNPLLANFNELIEL